MNKAIQLRAHFYISASCCGMNCGKMLLYVVLSSMFALSGALLDPATSETNPDHTAILQLITQEQSLRLQLETQIHDQQKQINSLISQMNNLTDQVTKDRRQVAFFGTVGAHIPASDSSKIVKFQHITTNIGNAYSSSTGVFHCPVSGLYLFSCTILGDVGHQIEINMYQNGNAIARPYTGASPSVHTSATDTAVVHANAGDEIYLSNFLGTSTYLDRQSRFVAVLLEAD